MDPVKIQLKLKKDLRLLPVGTRVVFHERQCYCNERYYFGIVVKGTSVKSKKIQLVETVEEEQSSDPITSYSQIIPQWDHPLNIYRVTTGRGQNHGCQWLRSWSDRPLLSDLSFVPIYHEVYDPEKKYVNCYDHP